MVVGYTKYTTFIYLSVRLVPWGHYLLFVHSHYGYWY